ncbi:hypothetical protein G7046_g7568 [Stylonectria norvegica]|nr:hypothetical protein G7046_g7568 [Stylonectria norvegica]
MHRALTARWINRALSIGEAAPSAGVPLFLCPAVGYSRQWTRSSLAAPSSRPTLCARRLNHTQATAPTTSDTPETTPIPSTLKDTTIQDSTAQDPVIQDTVPTRRLPLMCSGCGAFSQSTDAQQLGHFDLESKRVKNWMHPKVYEPRLAKDEDHLVDEVLKSLDKSKLEELGLSPSVMVGGEESLGTVAPNTGKMKPTSTPEPLANKAPVCDRCHNLQHYSTTSDTAKLTMYHPTVESLRETIEESPHKYNHIYHIIDAADFPMSLIPRLNVLLGDIPIRTKNRRSRNGKFQKDRKTELSFIITRSDLLGPTKDIVDSMMPYLREVLRDSLGRLGGRVRLGNLRCVSAKRSWWTKEVREDIWDRGGAGWMVGKVNVGKSQLFEAVYPKGRMGDWKAPIRTSVSTYPRDALSAESITEQCGTPAPWEVEIGDLLPPPQPTQNYPDMPLVSSLPGTTASPIRIPFGNGKGELIDLPGLARSDLELFVKEEHRQTIIMKKRIVPEQITLKDEKSLILGGGLIRITPRTPNVVFLAYNFTPLEEHLTHTEKAIAFQNQTRQSTGVDNITLPGAGESMKHAGTFKLQHDVTKSRAGPLTRKNAIGLQPDQLPFRVLSTDILIEGVGYVEIVAQVRARDVDVIHTPQYRAERRTERPGREDMRQNSDPFADMMSNRRDSNESLNPKKRIDSRDSVEADKFKNYNDAFEANKRRDNDAFEANKQRDYNDSEGPPGTEAPEPNWPAIDVYSPEGRFIGCRQPINGWLNNKPRVLPEHRRSRPRRTQSIILRGFCMSTCVISRARSTRLIIRAISQRSFLQGDPTLTVLHHGKSTGDNTTLYLRSRHVDSRNRISSPIMKRQSPLSKDLAVSNWGANNGNLKPAAVGERRALISERLLGQQQASEQASGGRFRVTDAKRSQTKSPLSNKFAESRAQHPHANAAISRYYLGVLGAVTSLQAACFVSRGPAESNLFPRTMSCSAAIGLAGRILDATVPAPNRFYRPLSRPAARCPPREELRERVSIAAVLNMASCCRRAPTSFEDTGRIAVHVTMCKEGNASFKTIRSAPRDLADMLFS